MGTFFWLALKQCGGQPAVKPVTVCQLPAEISESSGLWVEATDRFWTHNDSGDDPVLYAFDSSGLLVHQLFLPSATNVDWEDLAFDYAGRMFIGDFGNNSQQRTDLKIHIVPWPLDTTGLIPGVLAFSYPDQVTFPSLANFDMEGFFFRNDSLYLFSKNKITNTTGYSKVYRLPADTGTYVAELLDSIHTGSPVTAADISPSGQRVVLLCYGKFILFETGGTMDVAQWQRRDYGLPLSQTEAIAFWGEDTVFLTDEQGKLYRIVLADLPTGGKERDPRRGMHIWPNPVSHYAWLELPDELPFPVTLRVFTQNGQQVFQDTFEGTRSLLMLPQLTSGQYLVQVQTDAEVWQMAVMVLK